MKKIIVFSILLVSLMVMNVSAAVVLTNFKGTVSIYLSAKQVWSVATKGTILGEKDKILTGANGTAELVFETGTTLKIKQNTELEMAQLTGGETRMSMAKGRIRAKIAKLTTGQKFELRSPAAVASVRGTEFIMGSDQTTGNSEVVVLEGTVEFGGLTADGQITNPIEVNPMEKCSTGSDGSTGNIITIDETEKNQLETEFADTGTSDSGTGTDSQQQNQEQASTEGSGDSSSDEQTAQDMLREEIHNFVQETKIDNIVVRDMAGQIQEADFQTGRTLLDVHGNIVRVEQIVQRPDAYTLQFLNLTKRNDYSNYKGEFAYTGPKTGRLDSMEATAIFNTALPNDINEWPKFMDSNKDNIFVTQTKFIMSSKVTNPATKVITEDKMGVETNIRTNKDDDLTDTTFISTSKDDKVTKTTEKWIYDKDINDQKKAAEVLAGTWTDGEAYPKEETVKDVNGNPSRDGNGDEVTIKYDQKKNIVSEITSLWGWGQEPMYLKKEGTSTVEKFWFQNEMYVISNNGGILSTDYFENSDKDPLSILDNMAIEQVYFVKKADKTTDFFANKNIDLIMTPDIFVAIGAKMASQIK